jgi:hypothetical protein
MNLLISLLLTFLSSVAVMVLRIPVPPFDFVMLLMMMLTTLNVIDVRNELRRKGNGEPK